ncbi:MAG: glutamate-5-semialdehyde dehydrogenase, partial [Pseudobutyrivibrio sp.]|nr:glutamate-5-semialdehyde dehydrogenase [Pseudobutyrivibrio sp.]
ECKTSLLRLSTNEKNQGLKAVAQALIDNAKAIMAANVIDMENGRNKELNQGLLDRLFLDEKRIVAMAEGLVQIAGLDDPIGEVTETKKRPNGLLIGKKTVPLGVVGVIYEARPNVTVDVFGLCFKTSNAVVLKGGSDALNSNIAIVKVIKEALSECGLPVDAITLIEDTSHETTTEMMRLNGIIDVLIPRGGAGLISSVVKNATIPVIETGTGNCHVFVDESADINMAIKIIENAKTQRIGVCNACESLVIHKNIKEALLPGLNEMLLSHKVEVRTDEQSRAFMDGAILATEEDFSKEFLDYIISVKTVECIDEAIDHINSHNTGHSETIVTNDYNNALKFQEEVDAACVYVNASTRFT